MEPSKWKGLAGPLLPGLKAVLWVTALAKGPREAGERDHQKRESEVVKGVQETGSSGEDGSGEAKTQGEMYP